MPPILLDCHTHTEYSFDSQSLMQDMCDTAFKKGISVYTVTDHCECELCASEHHDQSVKKSLEQVRSLQSLYQSQGLKLLAGVELGQPTQCLKTAEQVSSWNWDFIIGSLHSPRGIGDFYYIDFSQFSQQEINGMIEQYLKEILEMLHWGNFDTLAHLDYPLRYIWNCGRSADFSHCSDLIEMILKRTAQDGKALEMNTSKLSDNSDEPVWFSPLLKLFRSCGGELVTIGSDAHVPGAVARGLQKGMSAIHQAGFPVITYFENRKPVCVPLE